MFEYTATEFSQTNIGTITNIKCSLINIFVCSACRFHFLSVAKGRSRMQTEAPGPEVTLTALAARNAPEHHSQFHTFTRQHALYASHDQLVHLAIASTDSTHCNLLQGHPHLDASIARASLSSCFLLVVCWFLLVSSYLLSRLILQFLFGGPLVHGG